MIDFNRLTDYTKQIIYAAQQLMGQYRNSQMIPEHIMLAILEDNEGVCFDFVKELRLDKGNFKFDVINKIEQQPKISNMTPSQQLYLSNETNLLLDIATQEADKLKDDFISIEHILLAMTKLDNSQIQQILKKSGINSETILKAMKKIRGNKSVNSKNAEEV